MVHCKILLRLEKDKLKSGIIIKELMPYKNISMILKYYSEIHFL